MYLLFDIGGTKTRIAFSSDGTSFEAPVKLETPVDFSVAMQAYKTEGDKIVNGRPIHAVAAGVKFLNKERNGMLAQALLPMWANQPLKQSLSDMFQVPAYMENDTAIVGLGEAAYGAARGYGIVVYMTISTGVGGVRIIDGAIERSAQGFEPGHSIIQYAERDIRCLSCGVSGDLESYISGRAFERRFGKKPYDVTDPAIWDEAATVLAAALANVSVFWSPECIVVGGSMMKHPGISLDAVRTKLPQFLRIFPQPPELKPEALGDDGGLYGALAFVVKQHARL